MKRKSLILFFALCVASVVLFVIFNFVVSKKDYSEIIEKYSAEFGLEKELVFAVIKAESDFQEKAVSKSGAMGLMQIIPTTAKWIASEFGEFYEKQKMFEPETNIKYGCFYLRYLFNKFEKLDVVICAYNAGEGIVRDWLDEEGNLIYENISYEETRNYLKKVSVYLENYKKVG